MHHIFVNFLLTTFSVQSCRWMNPETESSATCAWNNIEEEVFGNFTERCDFRIINLQNSIKFNNFVYACVCTKVPKILLTKINKYHNTIDNIWSTFFTFQYFKIGVFENEEEICNVTLLRPHPLSQTWANDHLQKATTCLQRPLFCVPCLHISSN